MEETLKTIHQLSCFVGHPVCTNAEYTRAQLTFLALVPWKLQSFSGFQKFET